MSAVDATKDRGMRGAHLPFAGLKKMLMEKIWPGTRGRAERLAKRLYLSLSKEQQRDICLPWDYRDERRGLVRTFIANHWHVTAPCISSDFFSAEQQRVIYQIFLSLINPQWHDRLLRQLADDTHGHPWGQDQSIAFLGDPVAGPYQFLLTGRHLTLRMNGDRRSKTAFGGPVVYAHAATGFGEAPHHPGNVFWPQAQAAGRLYDMLNPAQQALAVVDRLPAEEQIGFRVDPPGVPAASFSAAQKRQLMLLLARLFEPYRAEDRATLMDCLRAQGGPEVLRLSFGLANRMSAPDWDVWRLEGPAFVWHFQGFPHVHGWVHVARTASGAVVNARRGAFIFPEHDDLR